MTVRAAVEDNPRGCTSQALVLQHGCFPAAVGLSDVNQSRRHQPGSFIGKCIMVGVGCCRLFYSVFFVYRLMIHLYKGFIAATTVDAIFSIYFYHTSNNLTKFKEL